MPVANHEGSTLTGGPGGLFVFKTGDAITPGSDVGHACLVQSVDVTTTVATEDILAIGYKGRAGLRENIGNVTVAIEGVLTRDGTELGSIAHDLDFYEAVTNDFYLTSVSSNGVYGKKAQVTAPFVTSIAYNFAVNASATTTWNFSGDNIVWTDSPPSPTTYALETSQYMNAVEFHEISVSGIAGCVQTCTFNATLNRTDIFCLGQKQRFDRPVTNPKEVTVSIETLAGTPGDEMHMFVTDYTIADEGFFTAKCGPVVASGLVPTDGGFRVGVGNNSTITMGFRGTNMVITY